MNKALIVAKREYLYNFRRPAFVFAAFVVPVLMIVIFVIVGLVLSEGDDAVAGVIGYVDEASIVTADVDTPDRFIAYSDEGGAREALDAAQVGAYFVVPPDYMLTGNIRLVSDQNLQDAFDDEIDAFLLAQLNAQTTIDLPLNRLIQPIDMMVYVIENDRRLTEDAVFGLFIVPFVLTIIMFMAVQLTGGFLIGSVVEEKANSVLEVLITSLTPMQLLLGKIIGLGVLGLTQLVFWVITGGIFLLLRPESEFLDSIELPVDLVLVALLYFVLIYTLQASLMAGIGAIVGSEQEGRQIAGILTIVMVIPFFVIFTFVQNPNGTVPVALTLIPFTAPLSAILRLGISNPPLWQIIASLGLLASASMIVIVGAARIFRWSLLMTGKRPTPRQIYRIIRGSQQPLIHHIRE